MSGLDLSAWAGVDDLVERAGTRTPDYCEAAIARTARVRQRPAWTFPGRWLPAETVFPAVRWVALAALLVLGLLAGLLLAGARHTDSVPQLPGNGLLAVALCGGEVHGFGMVLVDAVTGKPAGDPATLGDRRPGMLLGLSPDGTRVAYVLGGGAAGDSLCTSPQTGRVWVSAPDGTGATPVTGELSRVTDASWSPDGRRLAVSFSDGSVRRIGLANADGSGMRALDLDGAAWGATWQPGGDRLLVAGLLESSRGLYTVAADGAPDVRLVTRLAIGIPEEVDSAASWSPDGRWVAYARLTDATTHTTALHVVSVDGSGDRALPVDGLQGDAPMRPRWSPDGAWIVAGRGRQLVLVTPDGAVVREIGPAPVDHSVGLADWTWSPDGRLIAAAPHHTRVPEVDGASYVDPRVLVIDVGTGAWTEPYTNNALPAFSDGPILAWLPAP